MPKLLKEKLDLQKSTIEILPWALSLSISQATRDHWKFLAPLAMCAILSPLHEWMPVILAICVPGIVITYLHTYYKTKQNIMENYEAIKPVGSLLLLIQQHTTNICHACQLPQTSIDRAEMEQLLRSLLDLVDQLAGFKQLEQQCCEPRQQSPSSNTQDTRVCCCLLSSLLDAFVSLPIPSHQT